jgi:Fe-S-cluster containining protein
MIRNDMKRRKPEWWEAGIRFTCLPNCGRCCDEPDGLVYLSREDVIRISSNFGISIEKWLEKDTRKTHDGRHVLKSTSEKGTCIYINEDKSCQIHSVKPDQCSAFPFWGENVRDDPSWRKTIEICPGLVHPDAILIEGDTIRAHIEADANAERGFRKW